MSIFKYFLISVILIIFTYTATKAQNQTITRVESVQSLYLELFKDNQVLGSATGFIIKSKSNKNYLITNWHVVTNKNPINGLWLSNNLQVSPNKIGIMHNAKALGKYSPRMEQLIDANSNILYKEFSIGVEKVDVVALSLKDTIGDLKVYPVNYNSELDSLVLQPTDRLFVLGFPKGVRAAPFLPIWKSGLIASEPDIDQEGKPIIWLDIPSFGGMSGSPVYLITDKLTYKNGNSVNILGGSKSFFLGVFSHGQDVYIGALWKSNYLKMLFDSLP